MQDGLVTVVIPVYNAEKYLDRCISSIVNQTYRNLEILLVDDESPDNCPQICDSWAEKDCRIKVFHQKNQGAGYSRNVGIENATGEYICFIDSDDYIATETIAETYALAKKDNSNIVVFGLNTVDSNGDIIHSFVPYSKPSLYEEDEVKNVFLPEYIAPDPNGDGTRKFYMSSCVLLYSLRLINEINWRYVSERDIISEDVYSLTKLFHCARRVSIMPKAFYYYCHNSISFSRGYMENRYAQIKQFYIACMELCDEMGYSDVIAHRLSKPYLAYTIGTLKQEALFARTAKERKNIISSIINDDVLQEVLRKNKGDKVSFTRRILFFCLRNRLYGLSVMLLRLRE